MFKVRPVKYQFYTSHLQKEEIPWFSFCLCICLFVCLFIEAESHPIFLDCPGACYVGQAGLGLVTFQPP